MGEEENGRMEAERLGDGAMERRGDAGITNYKLLMPE